MSTSFTSSASCHHIFPIWLPEMLAAVYPSRGLHQLGTVDLQDFQKNGSAEKKMGLESPPTEVLSLEKQALPNHGTRILSPLLLQNAALGVTL